MLLPVALAQSLKRMAQFRNVIVHDYIRINPEIVYSIVQENIPDILAFAQAVEAISRQYEITTPPARTSREGGVYC